MSSNLPRNLEDVSDPSDFKSTSIPALSELDVLERCYICKEFFRAPVITSCHHTFCSQCIREYLITNNLCPLCKTEVFESGLKRDVLLEEIVRSYTRLRPFLLMHLNKHDSSEVDSIPKKRVLEDEIEVTEILSSNTSASESQIQSKRQKREDSPEVIEISREDLVECPVCSRRMTAERLQSTHIDACLSGKSEPASPRQSLRPKGAKSSISSFFKPVSISPSSSSSPPPMSSRKAIDFKSTPENFEHQNHHLNETLRKPVELKRLQKLDFASLATTKLKEKLSNLHLPSSGTRNQLELRYNQFFVLYNSNLDSNHPVPEKVLRQKLHQWELSHSGFKKNSNAQFGSNNVSMANKSITDKNFSISEWMKEYGSEFKELIKMAKNSLEKEKEKGEAKTLSNSEKPEDSISNKEILDNDDPVNSDAVPVDNDSSIDMSTSFLFNST
ncbi:RAD18 [Candida pseudojiufengensis]|uniref:RAD18 n=1 Tax=Candida pseudojiufengensis TaxID=497109 RepID=UPI0022246160|nr:RAD18 [Candida pseudojiufengensis]KAI5963061.1 RAD18 [Candida pseudojiufengensis]